MAWAIAVRKAQGYTRLGWSAASLALLGGFIFLLGRAPEVLPLGTSYAV